VCVSLSYYLPLTAGNSLHLSIHWPGGDKQDFDSIEAVSILYVNVVLMTENVECQLVLLSVCGISI